MAESPITLIGRRAMSGDACGWKETTQRGQTVYVNSETGEQSAEKPELLVFNQIDRLPPEEALAIAKRYDAIPVSALKGEGLRELLTEAEEILWDDDDLRPGEEERFADLAASGN